MSSLIFGITGINPGVNSKGVFFRSSKFPGLVGSRVLTGLLSGVSGSSGSIPVVEFGACK